MLKYQHVERITDGALVPEIRGLTDGEVTVFPKLDGANHCVWFDEDKGRVKCASRNQEQNAGWDSTGFYKYFSEHPELAEMAEKNKGFVFYGEYLTPHTIRDYDEDAYGKWYVFDMYDLENGIYLPYEFYSSVVGYFGVECIPPICTIKDPSFDDLLFWTDKATFLHGDTPGEGIVVKNYSYRNEFGRSTWGKIVRDEFMNKFKSKNKGEPDYSMEDEVVLEYLTKDFCFKEAMKLVDERGGFWEMKLMGDFIPRLWKAFISDFGTEIMMKYVDSKADSISLNTLHKVMCKRAVFNMKYFAYPLL